MPEFTAKYGIPPSSVRRALEPLLRDKCTAEEASRLLFGAVAKPTAFVHIYFKVQRNALPPWLRDFGEGIQRTLVEFRRNAEPLLAGKRQAEYLRSLIRADAGRIGAAFLEIIDTSESEQGITPAVLRTISNHPEAIERIPCCELAKEIVLGYLDQTVATAATPSKIEDSFGGDLIHALYIDCVDVWRGDRRFCELLRQRLPSRRSKLEPSLARLPDHIASTAQAANGSSQPSCRR